MLENLVFATMSGYWVMSGYWYTDGTFHCVSNVITYHIFCGKCMVLNGIDTVSAIFKSDNLQKSNSCKARSVPCTSL